MSDTNSLVENEPTLLNRPHYGSTESIGSFGTPKSSQNTLKQKQSKRPSQADMISERSSSCDDILYDTPKSNQQPHKSRSRVTSVGKLRLHVESFRQTKHSSGTQTDLTAMKSKYENGANSNHTSQATGTFKKHTNTAPSKPLRKTKNAKASNVSNSSATSKKEAEQRSGVDCGSGRSDRSASPDNSSTSGYDIIQEQL